MSPAAYKFAPRKALQAIHHMVSQRQPFDLHAALKSCYFADKSHLNEHFQPIFGATYKAMKYGPVPLEIYELIKGESIWLWETETERLPWRLDGHNLFLQTNHLNELTEFSDSEIEHLDSAIEKSCGMSFTARTAATHGFDWQNANGGVMLYEDMIASNRVDRAAVINYIQETARHVRL